MAINLGKQYGPLPLGGWAVVIIGGLGVGYFINRSQGESSGSVDDGTSSDTPIGDPSGAGGGQFIYDPPTGVPQEPEGGITNNLEWGIAAKNYLVGKGFDPVATGNAVEKYLSGMKLTTTEKAWIGLAIAALKAPPEAITPVEEEPTTPTPKPPTTKPPVVTTKPGVITITSKPSSVGVGKVAAFKGRASAGGRYTSMLIYVERKPPNSKTWTFHTMDGSNSSGNWGVNTAFGSKGTWGIRFTIWQPGVAKKSVETTVRVV